MTVFVVVVAPTTPQSDEFIAVRINFQCRNNKQELTMISHYLLLGWFVVVAPNNIVPVFFK